MALKLKDDFGAMGIGYGNDDTAAVQAALDYCQNNNEALDLQSSAVSAFYNITDTLRITKPVVTFSNGARNAVFLASGLASGKYLLDIDGTAFGTFEQAELRGMTLMRQSSSDDCLRIKNASASNFSDISVRNCRHGIVYTGTRCFSNSFDRIRAIDGVTGSTVLMTEHTGGGQHTFENCSLGGTTGFAISYDTITDNVTLRNVNFEQCLSNSFYSGGTVLGLKFDACRTEGCDSIDYNINPTSGNVVRGLVIDGNVFGSSDNGSVPRINLGGAGGSVRGFRIEGNTVSHGDHNFSSYLVNLNGDGESGTIANNTLDGLIANCAPVNVMRANVSVRNNEANNGKFASLGAPALPFTFVDASGAGLTLPFSEGKYRRIDNIIYWWAAIRYPANSNGATAMLSGLPFTVAVPGVAERAGAKIDATTSTSVISVFHGPWTGNTVRLQKAGLVVATNADCSGQDFYLSGSYVTTDP